MIVKLNASLSQLILSLPNSGPLYTASYPIWPFFVAAVTCDETMCDTLYHRVWDMRIREKSVRYHNESFVLVGVLTFSIRILILCCSTCAD